MDDLKRCSWVDNYPDSNIMTTYHDAEWGQPNQYSDKKLFELLTLEVFQAGLSWETSLKRRSGMNTAFLSFDIDLVSKMTNEDIERLKNNPNIISNKLKITSTIHNARVIRQIRQQRGSFF